MAFASSSAGKRLLHASFSQILVWCRRGMPISVDSREHRCQYLFYGEFTRCPNLRDSLLPRTRLPRPTPVRGPPCVLRRRPLLYGRLPPLWLHPRLVSRLVSSFGRGYFGTTGKRRSFKYLTKKKDSRPLEKPGI